MRREEKGFIGPLVALAGNPNVGKSTVFNSLTGLRQHTGNWPGKTVDLARGFMEWGSCRLEMVDLPGTYSLRSHSREEEVAEEFLREQKPDCVVMVCDATCLERNLNLTLQVLEHTGNVVLCVNLLDEAARQRIHVNLKMLETELGIPVVGTAAGSGQGLDALRDAICEMVSGKRREPRPIRCPRLLVAEAERLAKQVVTGSGADHRWGKRLDHLLMTPRTGVPLLMLLLLAIFWLTISGANYPSVLLERGFAALGRWLRGLTAAWNPDLNGLLLDGIYDTVTRVISVMLPPMAIFFPLFTLLEDWGLLPRIAFLLDRRFSACGACGKQGLTMCMGIGCNTVGVTGCRIIDSPRERLIAILTNAFMPCNGKFPAMIAIVSIFFAEGNPFVATLILTGAVLLGVLMTFLFSGILSRTVLCGKPSSFALELPPYRMPNIPQVLLRSLLDRTVFVLGRAVLVAAPAGVAIWCLTNLGGGVLLRGCAGILEPLGRLMGLDGVILLSFVLALPANELVLPVLLMQLSGSGVLMEMEHAAMEGMLLASGWTWRTALCTLLFFLLHWPCSTTLLTVRKETGKLRWMLAAFLLPTVAGILICMAVNVLTG